LARIEKRNDSRTFKFLNADRLTGIVLGEVIELDPQMSALFNTACGGPLQTLIGMANLEPKAFGFSDGEELLDRTVALKLLANFWKRMGKQRPVALLGDSYAKGIY